MTEDQHAHFVNAYEVLEKFQRLESEIAPLLKLLDIVVSDGNVSTANLVENFLFRDKTKIAIQKTAITSVGRGGVGGGVGAIAREVLYLSKREALLGTLVKRDHGSLTTKVWD